MTFRLAGRASLAFVSNNDERFAIVNNSSRMNSGCLPRTVFHSPAPATHTNFQSRMQINYATFESDASTPAHIKHIFLFERLSGFACPRGERRKRSERRTTGKLPLIYSCGQNGGDNFFFLSSNLIIFQWKLLPEEQHMQIVSFIIKLQNYNIHFFGDADSGAAPARPRNFNCGIDQWPLLKF